MKTYCLPLSLAWMLAVPSAHAQEATPAPPPITLTYPAMTGIAWFSIPPNTARAATPLYATGGEAVSFPVTVQAPLGTHLRVYADVTQQTAGLAAPWQKNVPVSDEIAFGDRTSMLVACKLPAMRTVLRKTRVLVTLRTDPKADEYPGGMVVQGFVYPREEPSAWRKQFAALLARSGIRRVAVFGHWKNPPNFLRERKVEFEDLGDDWPAHPDAGTLYLASGVIRDGKDAPLRVPEAFVETRGVRLVLFEPWDVEVLPPGVYQTAGAAGGVWKVTLPDLFVGPGLNDPHALEILTTLFEQILPPHQPVTGDNPESTPTP